MKAFHSDAAVKAKYLSRVQAHRAADQIIKGRYWQSGKGCAVGCTIHSAEHASYETELGIPRVLAYLEDRLFERMPNERAMEWPEKFLDAIPVGADLSLVWPRYAVWLLGDPDAGVVRFSRESDKPALLAVVAGYQSAIDGKPLTKQEWKAVWEEAARVRYAAAADAAAYDAYAAADAAYAAYAAADAAYAADAYAADAADAAYAAAYDAYAAADARGKHIILQSEKLLQLLKEAPCQSSN